MHTIGLVEGSLLTWYRANGRDLPWRRTRDPYAILVSEVMLHQTQVERVVPRYVACLERWPTAGSLASASPAEVIREWQGLGYNRRALNLYRAARLVAEQYELPFVDFDVSDIDFEAARVLDEHDARRFKASIDELKQAEAHLYVINMGGTPIGTKLSAQKGFVENCAKHLGEILKKKIVPADDLIAATSDLSGFANYSNALNTLSIRLSENCK